MQPDETDDYDDDGAADAVEARQAADVPPYVPEE